MIFKKFKGEFMKKEMLSANLEDYLETILALEKIKKVARGKDIAERMGVLPGSVTGALKSLNKKGLINWEKYGYITLTEKGCAIAEEITKRHNVFHAFLFNVLQVDEETANTTACRMEHAMDAVSMEKFISFMNYINSCKNGETSCVQSFAKYCEKEN